MTAAEQAFVEASCNKLRQLTDRIAVCLSRLTPDQVWARQSENENAIGNLLLHLQGNVRQWIGHGVGGLDDVRQRDDEFNARGGQESVDGAMLRLRETVEQAVGIIQALDGNGLAERIRVQNYDINKLQAIYHVVEHFSQHTGQIIFATKLLTGEELGFYRHLKNPHHGQTTP